MPSDEDEQHRGRSEPGSKEKKVGCHIRGEDEEGKAHPVGEQGQGEKHCQKRRVHVRLGGNMGSMLGHLVLKRNS